MIIIIIIIIIIIRKYQQTMTAKFFITAFLYVVATVLFIAAAPTSVLTFESTTRLVEFGFFESCTTTTNKIKSCERTSSTCDKFMDVAGAAVLGARAWVPH